MLRTRTTEAFSKLRTKIGPEEYRIMKQFSYAMVEAIMTNELS
jgi:hypothetical protein